MPPLSLLIKPSSGQCNIQCRYCFYCDIMENRKQKSYGFMSQETLENVIKKALSFASDECTIAYQGGEPTLSGIDFFEQSIEFQKKYNIHKVKINNAIQTNGCRIDKKFAEFFVKNNFLVGLSLDGIKDTNDVNRIDKAGKGTYSSIMNTAHIFNNYNVQYNIVTVVNAQTAKRISSIYNFYQKNKFDYLQFIPCLDPLGDVGGQQDYSITPLMYGEFLIKLFDMWYRDIINGKKIHIRQFENYVEMLMGYRPESCGMGGICNMQNVVEADGSVYPCDFYVLDEYRLGNLNTESFEEIASAKKVNQFIEESLNINEKCKECKYYFICRGGCKRNRESQQMGQYQLNYFCQSFYMFFEHSMDRLNELVKFFSNQI